jgi:hypothetical protein
VVFAVVLVAFFVLRLVAATIAFFFILPSGDRCPVCDEVTLRIQSKGWNTLVPWCRTSWCMRCDWEGLHRRGPITASDTHAITQPRQPVTPSH